MKRYIKAFCHRGLVFAGFGPIILAIVYAILQKTVADFSLDGVQLLVAIVSVYGLAFVQAGASVFNQIESWSLPKSLFCHLGVLYGAYVTCYLVNNWIPFEPLVLVVFTGSFLALYFLIWGIVYMAVKLTSRRLNAQLYEKREG